MFPVNKTKQAPASLAKNKSYREKDVIEALAADFHNKCYICEVKDPLVLNVEHFRPHGDDVKLKYDWENLFFACGRCNNIKGARFNEIHDCTRKDVDVLMAVKHVFPTLAYSNHVDIIPMDDSEQTKQTAELISKAFNDNHTGNKDLTRIFLMKKLMKKYRRFLELTLDYDDEDTLKSEREIIEENIRNMLSVEYEFSAFIRWAIIDAPKLHHLKKGIF
ncbi:HNH endonuclease [Serratia marcescens]|nr:HNH endonuclease [Serratia marcescens]